MGKGTGKETWEYAFIKASGVRASGVGNKPPASLNAGIERHRIIKILIARLHNCMKNRI